jgi:hypothetical protein
MNALIKCCVAIMLIVCILFVAGSFDTQAVGGESAAWYNSSWARRQSITIDYTQVVGDLIDFPILLTEANVQTSLFSHANSDGSDIVITSSDGVTRLKRELVEFHNVSHKMELYVKVTSLSSSADKTLYIYYYNSSASVPNDYDTWDSHYIMVQHMEDATSTTISDSTSNHFLGNKGNVTSSDPKYKVNPSIEVDGKIGKAQEFDRSWINVGVHTDFNLREYFTVEVWAYPVRRDEQYNGALVSHDMLSTGRQWDAPILMDSNPYPYVTLQVRKSNSDYRVRADRSQWDAWNHISAVYNNANKKRLFLNGDMVENDGNGQLDDALATPLVIGTHFKLNWENNPGFYGTIDEVRISNVARSDAWILTGYKNQLNPSFFSSAGEEELVVTTVAIEIKPGSFPNSINPRSKGVIPVAVLTTVSFDATTVDPTTVRFGPGGTEANAEKAALEDVDEDGDMDMILHFRTQDVLIQCRDTTASLTGETFYGQKIRGSDSIVTVGCK